MKIIRINKDGTMNEINIKCTEKNISSLLTKNSNSKGEGNIKELYSWIYEKNNIKCFGWFDGDAGFENKHELPPSGHSSFLEEDSSSKLLFGDLFIIFYDMNEKIKDYSVSEYSCFYDFINEGFDDCFDGEDYEEEENKIYVETINESNSEDEYESEEDEEEDEEEENKINYDSKDLLDSDLNNY